MACRGPDTTAEDRRAQQTRIDKLTRLLCEACGLLDQTDADFTPALAEWWDQHQELDRKRTQADELARVEAAWKALSLAAKADLVSKVSAGIPALTEQATFRILPSFTKTILSNGRQEQHPGNIHPIAQPMGATPETAEAWICAAMDTWPSTPEWWPLRHDWGVYARRWFGIEQGPKHTEVQVTVDNRTITVRKTSEGWRVPNVLSHGLTLAQVTQACRIAQRGHGTPV
jgi:hypothetical protein